MKFKLIKYFEIVAFIYFLVGALCGLQIQYSPINFEIPEIIVMFFTWLMGLLERRLRESDIR